MFSFIIFSAPSEINVVETGRYVTVINQTETKQGWLLKLIFDGNFFFTQASMTISLHGSASVSHTAGKRACEQAESFHELLIQ